MNKSAVAEHFWSHKHKFEEEPKLLKLISNKPLSELLFWEENFIYKNKEVAINFDIPQFTDLFKLMDPTTIVRGRSRPHTLPVADDGSTTNSKSAPA